jgi:hypothetical protein
MRKQEINTSMKSPEKIVLHSIIPKSSSTSKIYKPDLWCLFPAQIHKKSPYHPGFKEWAKHDNCTTPPHCVLGIHSRLSPLSTNVDCAELSSNNSSNNP